MKKTAILFTVISLLIFGLVLNSAKIVQRVVARVNDEIITKTELEKRENSLRRSAYSRYSSEKLDKALSDIDDETLQNMIQEKMFLQRAEEIG